MKNIGCIFWKNAFLGLTLFDNFLKLHLKFENLIVILGTIWNHKFIVNYLKKIKFSSIFWIPGVKAFIWKQNIQKMFKGFIFKNTSPVMVL